MGSSYPADLTDGGSGLTEILEFKKEKVYIVNLRGRLDSATSPPFGDKFPGLIDQGETRSAAWRMGKPL